MDTLTGSMGRPRSIFATVALVAATLAAAGTTVLASAPPARAAVTTDPSWGSGGTAVTSVSNGGYGRAVAVAAAPGGKVVAAGWVVTDTTTPARYALAVVRYRADGTLDPAWSGDGILTTTALGGSFPNVYGAVVLADGSVIVSGRKPNQIGDDIAATLVKFTPAGTFDVLFGFFGSVNILGPTVIGSSRVELNSLVLDGPLIVAAGTYSQAPAAAGQPCALSAVIVRMDDLGALDSSFEGNGVVSATIASGVSPGCPFGSNDGLTLRPSGGGYAASGAFNSPTKPWVLQVDGAGGPVTGYGPEGLGVLNLAGITDPRGGSVTSAEGRLVLGGHGSIGAGDRHFLAGVRPEAPVTDSAFGTGGLAVFAPPGTPSVRAVGTQTDGKVVSGGSTLTGGIELAVLSRATRFGVPDAEFGPAGLRTFAVAGRAAFDDVALGPPGRLYAAGYTGTGGVSTHRFLVMAFKVSRPPAAALTGTGRDLAARFSTAGTSDPDGDLAQWSLDRGDGSVPRTGAGAPPAEVAEAYGVAGAYSAKLTVTDTAGNTASASANVAIGPRVFLFAEGTVRPGFVEYLTIQNLAASPGAATIEFQAADDAGVPVAVDPATVPLPALSRVTFSVSDWVRDRGIQTNLNISTRVRAPVPIVAERPIYFAADPALGQLVDGGTVAVGATSLAADLFFAEGTVRPGFVEYLTLQNPGTAAAQISISFQIANDAGASVSVDPLAVAVGPRARVTINVNQYLAGRGITEPVNVSGRVQSDQPILAERPVYFAADPALGVSVDGGHTVLGSTSLGSAFFFAEGTVRPGFVEYLTIQNPGDTGASVTLQFPAARDDGTPVAVPDLAVAVPGRARATVRVNDHLAQSGVAPPVNLSVAVSASGAPILAERPLYFAGDPGLGSNVDGGTNVVGSATLATEVSFAEGTTRTGFVEYLTLGNPANGAAMATIHFATSGGTAPPAAVVSVAPRARLTVRVNDLVPAGTDVALRVRSDRGLVAERVLYFATDPGVGSVVDGGSATSGFVQPVP